MKRLIFLLSITLLSLSSIAQEALFKSRLDGLQSKVSLNFNPIVESYINQYLQNPEVAKKMISKGNYYNKNIEDILVKNKLPKELKYLPAALSGLDNWVVSDDGGSGFWQMRYHVAKSYDLHISSYVDERRDYLAATQAAANYLNELHHMYENWLLAIAAYYADPIEVNKAIRMAGGALDYWKIHSYLPEKYQSAVPRFIATNYLFNYYKEHQIQASPFSVVKTDTVQVLRITSIQQVSRALDMNPDSLWFLNPIFKKKVIPFAGNPYLLNLPIAKAKLFRAMGDTVYTYGLEILVIDTVSDESIEEKPEIVEKPATPKAEPKGDVIVYHTVKSGEFLGRIADMYDCNVSEVKKWNNLRSDRINVGQKLKLYVPASKQAHYKKINSMSTSERNRIINQD
jgi:membrane-bound lytic murein transglycosylase D